MQGPGAPVSGTGRACPKCAQPVPAEGQFCLHCGSTLENQNVEAAFVPKIQYYCVVEDRSLTIPTVLTKPRTCIQCNAAHSLVHTFTGTRKVRQIGSEDQPTRRLIWRVCDYQGFKCSACGQELLVGPRPERKDWEPAPVGYGSPRQTHWRDDKPLIRYHRGTCQRCGKWEVSSSCGNCGARVCPSDFSARHSLCMKCAPRCYDCGTLAVTGCRSCKRPVCKKHRRGNWFFTRCLVCRPAVEIRPRS